MTPQGRAGRVLGERIARRPLLRSSLWAAGGAAALASIGCGKESPSAERTAPAAGVTPTPTGPVQGGVLRTLGGQLGALPDPHQTRNAGDALLWQWAGNFLFRYAHDPYAVEADLAAALPETPGDGVTLIVRVRPEAKWQNRPPVNGRAVTAEDVKLSFDRIKALGAKSPRAGNYTSVDAITVIDAQTVQFKLKAPTADLLNVMADQFDIVLPKETAIRGEDAIKEAADITGSGAYEVQTIEPGRKAVLKRRSDGYWRPGTAWLDGWELLDLRDDGQKANGLLSGQGDVAELPPVLARIFEGRPEFSVKRTAALSRECLLINHNAARWKDPRVRLAASRALDRRAIYAAAFESEGLSGGPVSPAARFWAITDSEMATLPGYGDRATELQEAKKLLAAAGLADGFDDAVLTVSALKLDRVTEAVVASLAEAGIRLRVGSVGDDLATLTERARSGDFTVISTLFLSGIYPDAQLYLYHRTGAAGNYGKFTSAAVDARLDKQRGMYDTAQRAALVKEIQTDLINAPGPLWLGARLTLTATSARVHGLVATPFLSGYDEAESAWLTP